MKTTVLQIYYRKWDKSHISTLASSCLSFWTPFSIVTSSCLCKWFQRQVLSQDLWIQQPFLESSKISLQSIMYTELFSAKISLVHTTLNISSNITKGVLLLSSKNAWKSEKQVAIKIVQEKEWGHVIESIFSKLRWIWSTIYICVYCSNTFYRSI